MTVLVESYSHRTGEHCATTALRNILAHQGTELSEGMIFGLASGLGFFYLRDESTSPTRMFHGRTLSLEDDFGLNTGVPLGDRPEADDERAWQAVRKRIDRGEPVMVSTDTFYLGYQQTTSHFPGHRCVVVGYDDASRSVLIADRKFEEYQRCSYAELRRARNARDYPISCQNRYGDLGGELKLGRPLPEAIRAAVRRNALGMLEPDEELPSTLPALRIPPAGIPALRMLAKQFPDWAKAEDWSWAARFGYQVVIKRGAGGSFFRSLYADFLRESVAWVPELARALPAERMDAIAARWRDLAAVLRQQSEREDCDPDLFVQAGRIAGTLADAEECFFSDALALGAGLRTSA
jgi:hypothetical protein